MEPHTETIQDVFNRRYIALRKRVLIWQFICIIWANAFFILLASVLSRC